MAGNISVEVCGPTLSCLFYDILSSAGDQEGFLIGDVTTRVTDGISDSQLNFEQEEVIISIHYSLPCERVGAFYNGQGQIDEETFKKIIGNRYKDLIGWYRFRRNTTLDVFLRERTIHKNISKLLPTNRQPFFLFGIFTCTESSNIATHTMDHVFLRHNIRSFEGISLTVVNLGETSQSKYRKNSSLVLDRQRGFYGQLINSSKHPVLDASGTSPSINHIRNLHTSLQHGMKMVCHKVSETEQNIVTLEEEVRQLRTALNKASTRLNKGTEAITMRKFHDGKEQHHLNETFPLLIDVNATKSNTVQSSSNDIQEKLGKINLTGDSKLSTALPPKDVSSAENSLRKVLRSCPPSSELKMQLVNIEETPKKPKKETIDMLLDTRSEDNAQLERSDSPIM